MNDDTDKPLNTVGDDALEARITAWVLGEASSFEAGELEKLCAADPALGLFERRLRVLHGLVAEDYKTEPAVQWKLAAERRTKITDLLGVEPEVAERIEKTSRHFGRRALLALAACVVLTLVSISLIGGVGSSAKSAGAKEKSMLVSYSRAEAPRAMAPSEDYGAVERGDGAPVTKPDSAYSQLAQNSTFTSKPPPAASAEVSQPRGAVVRQEAVAEDQRKLLSAVEAGRQSRFRHTADAGIADETTVDAKAELDVAANSLALSKEKAAKGGAAGLPERQLAAGREPQGIAGPATAIATPAPAPAAKPDALAANERGTATRAKEEVAFGYVMDGATLNEGGQQPAEGAPEIASRNLIVPAEGMTIPGIPAAPGQKVDDIVTAGNRSGDGAITRNNIDAVLNNPNRLAKDGAKGDGLAALTGVWAVDGIAPLEESVETVQEGAKTRLSTGIASGPEVEYKTRNPKPGEPVSGASGGGADSLADAGGVQLEPPTQSRFGRGLQTGGEQAMEQDEAAAFGNQEELGRLSKDLQQVELGKNLFYSDVTSGGATGGTELMDLAKKQNEAEPATAVAGRWFGTATDESTKGLKDGNAPGGAPADPFFDATILSETQLGGLKRDLKDEFAPAPGDAEGEVLAKKLEQVDRTRERVLPPIDGPVADPAAAAEPARSEQALEADGGAAVDEVRRKLYLAEGASNLGKYDESRKAYEEVLRVDPTNEVARRGVEKVAAAQSDYYRAAYDQTRAELLENVDKAWELSVPPVVQSGTTLSVETKGKADTTVTPENLSELTVLLDFDKAVPESNGRYSSLAQKEMIRRQNSVSQSDNLREEGRTAYAAGNYAEAYRKYVESLQLLPDAPVVKDRRDYILQVMQDSAQALSATAERVGEKELAAKWMEKSVEWALKKEAPPKPAVVEPTAETVAADEPFSTFSLHVSDASFKLAQAAMERGEVPAAEGIRPEEFYNAFDYGDPAPASGEPVVCVTEQSAHPAFAQRNLLRIGVRTGSQGRGASTPLNLTLLLDHSGSMEREDRNAGLAMAVRQLSGLLKEGDTITVAGFSRQPRLLADRLPGARAQELNDLIARTPSEGGTNLEEGLKLGEELAKRQFNPAAQNRVVLFTDGAANLGDARPEALQARIEGLRQQGIAFDAAGFGADGLNDKLLERLTRNGNGRYYIVDGPEDADAGFAKQLAGAFRPAAENVKVQVRFNPARVAKYKLIGFEEHRLKKEDFRNDAVDAAEMAAEEAGNALYQIETLPQGEGEVGEVSVRFRDVASGQMVERTWTIPYDAQAPAFDRATPSIQLAGLAAFTAEKLRAAPMADAVDFQQLGQVYAGVRARYPNSQPVADLGSMIGKMK